MKNKNIDLDEAFKDYFHGLEGFSIRSERYYDDCEISDDQNRHRIMTLWAKELFIAGARAMANDTIEALGDYATATSGINEVKYNVSEAYDIAAVDLQAYYDKVLPK